MGYAISVEKRTIAAIGAARGNPVEDIRIGMLKRRWMRWLLALLGWTGVAVFFASQTYLSYKPGPPVRVVVML